MENGYHHLLVFLSAIAHDYLKIIIFLNVKEYDILKDIQSIS